MTAEADLLVVGCGIAGMSASVTALQAGLRVVQLERAEEEDFGGNSRWTEAYLRMKSDSEVAEDFEERFAQNAGANLDPNVLDAVAGEYAHWPSWARAHPLPDPELVAHFAAQVPPTIAWLKAFGLKFGPQPIYLLTQSTSRIAAQGGGLALITRLMQEAQALGAELRFRTTAVDLLRDDAGRVLGVLAVGEDGLRAPIRARATLLASGGYQGNPEMMTRYVGPHAAHIRPVARGGYYNRGEGIRMALAAGEAPAGDFGSYHAEPVDPRSRQPEAVVHLYPYGVLLNRNGERFVDEGPGPVDQHYDPITRTIGEQPEGIAWVILDAGLEEVPRWKTAVRSDVAPVEAGTIEELVRALELPARALETIEAFNRACPADTRGFKPLEPDGLAARGLPIGKSHWSRPIRRAPFRAWPIIAANCFTFGGLKVNVNAQVLDGDGKVMPGLYAAGETVGLYHQTYTGSTSVLRGAVFGRTAARHVAGVVGSG